MVAVVTIPALKRSANTMRKFSSLKLLLGSLLARALQRGWAQGQKEEAPKCPPIIHPAAWVPDPG